MKSPVKRRTYTSSLRAAQAKATRQRILDSAVDELAENGTAGLTVTAVAERADVSERTVYNHFGALDQLVDATLEHLNVDVLPEAPYDDAENLPTAIRATWTLTAGQERVMRATTAAFAASKPERYGKVRKAAQPLVDHLDEREARIGIAGITVTRTGAAYLALRDDIGLSSEEAADTMAWLASLAIADLRRRNARAARRA
ncbi:MAG: hypothetical protein QOD30_1177 [Actinomycetota bacterium]|jgi:AcrR family transcriptional regulator|nr:hypothetical protein [Actinomycetota bacterium]